MGAAPRKSAILEVSDDGNGGPDPAMAREKATQAWHSRLRRNAERDPAPLRARTKAPARQSLRERCWFAPASVSSARLFADNSLDDGAHFVPRIRRKRTIGGLQQFRLQFRRVFLQVPRPLSVKPHLL